VDVSRRRNDHPPLASATLTATTEDFSDQELDFFRRGDELERPAGDKPDPSDADA
jgi:hypothetical protein